MLANLADIPLIQYALDLAGTEAEGNGQRATSPLTPDAQPPAHFHSDDSIPHYVARAKELFPECSFVVMTNHRQLHKTLFAHFSENADAETVRTWVNLVPTPEFFSIGGVIDDGSLSDLSGSKLAELLEAQQLLLRANVISEHVTAVVGMWRSHDYGEFSAVERHTFDELATLSIINLHFQAKCDHMVEYNLGSILDNFEYAMIVIDPAKRVLYKNICGATIETDGNAICEIDGRIHFSDTSTEGRLDRAITHLMHDSAREDIGKFSIPIRDGIHGPVSIEIIRLASSTWLGTGRIGLVLSLKQKRNRHIGFEQLVSLGVTKAEARLALALLEGKSVTAYAEERGISVATVRVHLRRLMLRFAVNRQADLIRKLLSDY